MSRIEELKKGSERYGKWPVVDLHARFSPRAVANGRRFTNVTELLLGLGDPVLRALRAAGVEEIFLTGEGSDFEKFSAVLAVLPRLCGHPALDALSRLLKELLGCEIPLLPENSGEIWHFCAEKLAQKPITPKTVLKKCNVTDLAFPERADADLSLYQRTDPCGKGVSITPIFAPVSALSLKSGLRAELKRLSRATGVEIADYSSLCAALLCALDRFEAVGCRMAYHEMPPSVQFVQPNEYRAGEILAKALAHDGKALTAEEKDLFFAQMMRVLGREYKKRGMMCQLYLGAARDTEHECARPTGGVNADATLRLWQYLKGCDALCDTVIFVQNFAEFDAVEPLLSSFAKDDGIEIWFGGTLEMPLEADARRHIEQAARVTSITRYLGVCSGAASPLAYLGAEGVLADTLSFVHEKLSALQLPFEASEMLARALCYQHAKQYFFKT